MFLKDAYILAKFKGGRLHFLYLDKLMTEMDFNRSLLKAAFYCFVVLISVAGLTEIYLRATHKYLVFSEMNDQDFYTEYGKEINSWFHTRQVNDTFVPAGPDFHYPYITNRYGFRDKNYDTVKSPSTYRILVTGDSFAEGEGTGYDSTWPRIMEKMLLGKGIHAEVIDAGVAGSDIFYDYVYYLKELKKLHPNLIIASLNSSDYTDFLTRGGMERFQKDGTTHLKPAPWYMFLFIHSRLFRAWLHKTCGYNSTGLFVSYKDFDRSINHTNSLFVAAFKRFEKEAYQNGAQFVTIVHPTPTEIKFPQVDVIKTDYTGLNNLCDSLTYRGIRCFNLTKPMVQKFYNTPMEQLSYPHDFHYTPMAYAYMGELVADSLLGNQIIK